MAGSCDIVFGYPMLLDLERLQTPFAALAAHRRIDANLTSRGQTSIGGATLRWCRGAISRRWGLRRHWDGCSMRMTVKDDQRVARRGGESCLLAEGWRRPKRTDRRSARQMIVNRSGGDDGIKAPAEPQNTTIGLAREVLFSDHDALTDAAGHRRSD